MKGDSSMNELENVDFGKVREWLEDTDGYAIMAPEFFVLMGFRPEFIERFDRNHGGGEGKYAVSGNPNGVSEFEFINGLARRMNVTPCRMFTGRGSNFRGTRTEVLRAISSAVA